MTRDGQYLRAMKRVMAKRGFYRHLTVYVAVTILLGVVDVATGGTLWFQWPLLGWGIGVILHGFNTFGPPADPVSEEAIEREIALEVERGPAKSVH